MLASLMILALAAAPQDAAPAPRPKVECTKGPASKTFAAQPWLAYGCSDNTTVLLVAPKDNPAAPFSFMLIKGEADYTVYGQGTGDKAASTAADTNLRALTQDQLGALAREINALR